MQKTFPKPYEVLHQTNTKLPGFLCILTLVAHTAAGYCTLVVQIQGCWCQLGTLHGEEFYHIGLALKLFAGVCWLEPCGCVWLTAAGLLYLVLVSNPGGSQAYNRRLLETSSKTVWLFT